MPTTETPSRRRFFPAAPSAQQDPGRVVEMEITLQPLVPAAPPQTETPPPQTKTPPPPDEEEPA